MPTINNPKKTNATLVPTHAGHAEITTGKRQLKLAYEVHGNQANPAILLIMGLGTQLIAWPDPFVKKLVDGGLQVIRFDNRDIGLSSKIKDTSPVKLPIAFARAKLGLKINAPYTLVDMAADAVGLLDALNIEQAHIMGASMGGMIAQIVAADYPEKASSLISVMSTSGRRRLPLPKREALLRFFQKPDNQDTQTLIDFYTKTYRIIGSPGYPQSDQELAEKIKAGLDRSYYPAGTVKQLLAILASPNRAKQLKNIQQPALIIHGKHDPLVPVEHGRDTAKLLPNAQLEIIPGMGHDLAPALYGRMADLVLSHVHRVEQVEQVEHADE